MDLLLLRHAPAEDREAFAATGLTDALRPLTERGRGRMLDGARGLARLMDRCDVIATSPYVRSAETAELLATALDGPDPIKLDALTPEADYEALLAWLRTLSPEATVAIVGHEPHLSNFVGLLVTGRASSWLDLKKGSATLLHLPPPIRPGSGLMRWAMAPGQLRRLGKV
jgi:phosphohistidine phosphatase